MAKIISFTQAQLAETGISISSTTISWPAERVEINAHVSRASDDANTVSETCKLGDDVRAGWLPKDFATGMIYNHPDCRAADNLFDKQAHKFNGDCSYNVIDTHLKHISTFLLSKILTITSANAVNADAVILDYLTRGDILLMNGNNRKILSPDICVIPLRLVFLSSIAEMLSTAIELNSRNACTYTHELCQTAWKLSLHSSKINRDLVYSNAVKQAAELLCVDATPHMYQRFFDIAILAVSLPSDCLKLFFESEKLLNGDPLLFPDNVKELVQFILEFFSGGPRGIRPIFPHLDTEYINVLIHSLRKTDRGFDQRQWFNSLVKLLNQIKDLQNPPLANIENPRKKS